jgi:rubrerythrin
MAGGDGTDAGLLAELNDLLQLDHDAVQAYTLAIQNLPRDAFGETLARFRDDHERHVSELAELIRAHGGAPARLPHLPTGAFKLALQGLGNAGGLRETLLAFKTNEAQVRDKYRRHAGRAHPAEVDAVLRRAAADEEKHYAWAAEMLERLGAGTDTVPGVAAEVLERVQGRLADAVEAAQRGVARAVGSLRPDR